MKILTKEQEAQHYNETLKGGSLGGIAGLGVGLAAVTLAHKRYAFFRGLTLPLKAFLITSSGTFAGIISADHWSRSYERSQNAIDQDFEAREQRKAEEAAAGKTFTERAMDFGRKERYKIVGGSWIASMIIAFSIVNRNKYLSGTQKLVQARVYAQFLTVGVLVATAAFEISDSRNETGRFETVRYIDPKDPEHKRMIERQQEVPQGDSGDEMWKDMIEAEEKRLKEREEDEQRLRKEHAKKHKKAAPKEQAKKDLKSKDKSESDHKKDDIDKEVEKQDKDDKKSKK